MLRKLRIICFFLLITSLFVFYNREKNTIVVVHAKVYGEPNQVTENLDGDMNKNGRIDLADVILLLKKYLGIDIDDNEEEINNNESKENNLRDMIIDTANAYYNKGELYQYDQYREHIFESPEVVNEYNPIFATCSTFVYQVYYATLGVRIPMLTKNHILNARKMNNNNSSLYVRYYIPENPVNSPNYYDDNLNNTSYISSNPNTKLTTISELKTNAINFLEKGDIIVEGFGSNGHTGMVYEVDKTNNVIKIIDNNGHVYNYDNYQEEYEDTETRTDGNGGSLKISNFEEWFSVGNYYNNGNWAGDVAFIKIVANDDDTNAPNHYLSYGASQINGGGLVLDNQTKYKEAVVRSKYKDLQFEKSYEVTYDDCSKTKSLYAGLESKITYMIKIKNNSQKAYVIDKITETLDTSKVLFEGSSIDNTYTNGVVTFSNINVPANEIVTISYVVKVINNNSLLGTEINSNGMIDDILPLKHIMIRISNSLSDYQKNRIIANYSSSSSTSESGIEYINSLYNSVFGVTLNLSDEVISYENLQSHIVKNTKINKNNDIIVGNLYGLKIYSEDGSITNRINAYKAWRRNSYNSSLDSWVVTGTSAGTIDDLDEYKNRTRTLVIDMLETGDIILTNGVMYLYINDGTSKLIKNGSIVKSGNDVKMFLRNLVGDDYVVLRPAMSTNFPRKTYTITYNKNTTDEVSNMPSSSTVYTYSQNTSCLTYLSDNVPIREGYTFAGWIQGDNVWQASTPWKRSNATNYELLAKWVKD